MTAAVPRTDIAALQGYLRALRMGQLSEMARNASVPSQIQPIIGAVLAERSSTAELVQYVYGSRRGPNYSRNGTHTMRWPPGVLGAFREALTTRQRLEPIEWGRLSLLRGLARAPDPDQRPPMEHPPAVRRRAIVRYQGAEISAVKLLRVYRDTEALLDLLRQSSTRA